MKMRILPSVCGAAGLIDATSNTGACACPKANTPDATTIEPARTMPRSISPPPRIFCVAPYITTLNGRRCENSRASKSKAVAQRELDHARAAVGDYLPQRRIGLESGGVEARRAVERPELGVVREVVELGAELQPVILVQSKHLRQRDVPLVDAGLAHDVLGSVAVIDVPGEGHAELRRARPADDGRVEPVLECLLEVVGLRRAEDDDASAFVRAGEVAGVRGRQRDVARYAPLDLGVAREPPVVEDLRQDPAAAEAPAGAGEGVDPVEVQDVLHVEARLAV